MHVIKQCFALRTILHLLLHLCSDRSGGHSEEIAMHHIRISNTASRFDSPSPDALHLQRNHSRAVSETNSDAIAVKGIYGYYRNKELIGQNLGLHKTGVNWITVA